MRKRGHKYLIEPIAHVLAFRQFEFECKAFGLKKSIKRMSAAELNGWYEEHVGYRPQADDPTISDDDLRALCQSYAEALADESLAENNL